MPREKKTVEEPSGDTTPVKELLEALEADRKWQQEHKKKCSEEHRELMRETYRQRFWTMKKAETQSYIEFGVQLKDLFRKWTAVAKNNPEELAEITVMEQLQNNMPRDLQVWICEKKPKTVVEAVTQADDYVLA
uniref:SCAN box domain-containing protein n=1 Tax=Amphimedon queenslandica TaxID=400682 RepID=A0A1X7VA14_AMPQE